jgi:hypothetical protein
MRSSYVEEEPMPGLYAQNAARFLLRRGSKGGVFRMFAEGLLP